MLQVPISVVTSGEQNSRSMSLMPMRHSPEEDHGTLEGGGKVEGRVRVALAGGSLAEVTYHRQAILRPLKGVCGAGSCEIQEISSMIHLESLKANSNPSTVVTCVSFPFSQHTEEGLLVG